MEQLIEKVDALDTKVSKLINYFKLDQPHPPVTPPQSSQGSNPINVPTTHSSTYAQKEYDYYSYDRYDSLSLRRYGYHLYSKEADRQNALTDAVKAKTKERVLSRLGYLLHIWKKRWDNPNTAAINIANDIDYVNNL